MSGIFISLESESSDDMNELSELAQKLVGIVEHTPFQAEIIDLHETSWLPMKSAPKGMNVDPVLLQLKNPIPNSREDLRRWDGVQFVGNCPYPDSNSGWCFAAPVGHGGFPDDWFIGWKPLPPKPGSLK